MSETLKHSGILLGVETTSRCNLACAMCCHPSMTRPKMDMEAALFDKVVDDIKLNGHTLWQLHVFGEPLMDAHFEDRMQTLASAGIRVPGSFSTNVTLLTPERTDSLIDSGFLWVHGEAGKVRLCIDSLDPEVYGQMRIGGNLEQVIENALYFISKTRASLPGLLVQRLISDRNPHESDDAFKQFGIPIRTQKVGRHHDKSRDLRCVKDDVDRRPECTLLSDDWLWIHSDGRATSCSMDSDCKQPCGDMLTQTVQEIWNGRGDQIEAFNRRDYTELAQCNVCFGNECTG